MPFCIEGGDVLNLSESVLAVGLSQRTSPEAVELLSENMFSDPGCKIRTVLALDIPDIRAFMHLDTVLTQVDTGKFVMHPGIQETLRIYEITPGNGPKAIRARELTQPLEDIFREKLELDSVSLIRCGGKDPIASEREQWNDASNTLCISPGVVAAYDRNGITNNILRDNGVTVLEMRGALAADAMRTYREELVGQVGDHASAVTGARVTRICPEGVAWEDAAGNEQMMPADTVLLAAGMRALSAEAERFRECAEEFRRIGDCARVGNVNTATRSAFDAAMSL